MWVPLPQGRIGAQAQPRSTAKPFEGVITIRLSARTPQGVRSAQAEYLTRAGSVRVNVGGRRGMAVLAAAGETRLHVLLPSQRQYAELPMTTAGLLEAVGAPPVDAQVMRTGRTDSVAGVSCELVTVSRIGSSGSSSSNGSSNIPSSQSGKASGSRPIELCLTRELGRYLNPLDALSAGTLPTWQKILGTGEFPLRVTATDGIVAFQVLNVERRVLPATLFAIPLDYKRTEYPRRR